MKIIKLQVLTGKVRPPTSISSRQDAQFGIRRPLPNAVRAEQVEDVIVACACRRRTIPSTAVNVVLAHER